MTDAYIALGSNLGDPPTQLQRAVDALSGLPRTRLHRLSGVYSSTAVGPGEQPDYLNAVARIQTGLAPLALLDALQAIEAAQGRERSVRWGPRTLDLDLLLYGELILTEPRLTVPHPRISERAFVLFPLADVAGTNLLLPDGQDLDKLVASCEPGVARRTPLALRLSPGA